MGKEFIELSTYFADDGSKEATIFKSTSEILYRVVGIRSDRIPVVQHFNTADDAYDYAEDFVTLENLAS